MSDDGPVMPRGSVSRTARLASLPLGAAGRATLGLGKRLSGRPADAVTAELQQRTAEQLFAVLGQLKGGAMKLGQTLSVFEAAVPEEVAAPYREALVKLQEEAPPMPVRTVHAVLAQQLGGTWRQRFADFDDQPAAAASIGQVHRATWRDGRDVAVKIQYPGAGDGADGRPQPAGPLRPAVRRALPGHGRQAADRRAQGPGGRGAGLRPGGRRAAGVRRRVRR